VSAYDDNPAVLAQDAVKFAQSRFGQHYLARLAKAVKKAQTVAENVELADSYRAHHATKAAALKAEIEYFATAQTIANDPGMLARLREGAQKRLKRKEDAGKQ